MPDHAALSAHRLAIYADRGWGKPTITVNEPDIGGLPCRFHVFTNTQPDLEAGRPFHAIFTDGLSDTEVVPGAPRTELVWYVDRAHDIHLEWIRFLAIIHRVDRVELFERAIPMTVPPSPMRPLAPGSILTSATLFAPPPRRDMPAFHVDGAETFVSWVLPITEAERALLRTRGGVDAFVPLLTKNQHPWVLDPMRKSYV